ncbi:dihydrodipicolinate synthase family protein [Spirochaetia bacterium]|nr:dihydrodipicolinate synthase family protein [Spirochaetia bacterium]
MKSLNGIFAPITTPFNEDGAINYDHLIHNVKKYAQTGLQGYLILGSNGENKSLTTPEKERVIKTILQYKGAEQAAMVGCIFESTYETIEFALMAEEAGADFITLLPPSYFKSAMKDPALVKYFTDVASRVKTPCLLYKAPQFSGGVDLSINLIKECAKHPNIAGIKDSSSSGVEKILLGVPKEFAVLSGSANTFFAAMLGGAVGGVLSIADYLPERAVELYGYITGGNLHKAVDLNQKIIRGNIEISGTYGVGGVKCAMDQTGYYGDVPRLPLSRPPQEGVEAIKASIKTLKLFNN